MSSRVAVLGSVSRCASVAARVALLGLASALPAQAAGESCLDVIHMEAPSDLGRELRSELERSELDEIPALECVDARVSLTRAHPGYRVELVRSSGRIGRSAQTVEMAAVWVDSWLRSGFAPESSAPDGTESPAAKFTAPPSETPPPPVNARGEPRTPLAGFHPLGFAALAEDGTFWLGPELGGRLFLSKTFWVGPDLGMTFDSMSGAGASRRMLRGGAAGGARFQLARKLALYPGLSAGYVTGSATATAATEQTGARGFYGGGACDFAFGVAGPVSVFAGLSGLFFSTDARKQTVEDPQAEQEDENEGDGIVIPAAVPSFLGGARLGLSVSLDGAP